MMIPIGYAILILILIISLICFDETMESYHINRLNKHKSEFNPVNVSNGLEIAQISRINICALVRNCKKKLYQNRYYLEKIGLLFKEYKIIFFENDSIDGTREYIQDWQIENKNVILLDCYEDPNCKLKNATGYEYGQMSNTRIKKMANYRERYLDYIRDSPYEFTMIVDVDLTIENIPIEGLLDVLSKYEVWNGVFINAKIVIPGSFGKMTVGYDAMAYETKQSPCVRPDSNLSMFFTYVKKYISLYIQGLSNDDLIPVLSSFNGVALYKTAALRKQTYISDNTNKICEHCVLHNNMDKLFTANKWISYQPKQGDGSTGRQIYNIFK